MKIKDTREAMLKVIREVGFGSKTYEQYVEELCDRLMEAGAFVPPVNIGGVVYAALPSIFGEEAEIFKENGFPQGFFDKMLGEAVKPQENG